MFVINEGKNINQIALYIDIVCFKKIHTGDTILSEAWENLPNPGHSTFGNPTIYKKENDMKAVEVSIRGLTRKAF